MKQLGWLVSAVALFAVLLAVQGWPALRDLNTTRESRLIDAPASGASLDGLQVAVELQIAAIAAQMPERAVVLVRLNMQVTPDARDAWKDCRVSLHNAAGEVWLPLTSASSDGAIKAIAPDRRNHGLCRLFARDPQTGTETVRADQLFLLPSDRLQQDLRLQISGIGTRPRALSFAVTPTVRQLP